MGQCFQLSWSLSCTYFAVICHFNVQFKSMTDFLKYICFSNHSYGQYKRIREEIDKYEGGLDAFSRGYEKLGFTRRYYVTFILSRLILPAPM